MKNYWDMGAIELAGLLREQKITSFDLTSIFLDRIKSQNKELFAFTQVLERRALKEAKKKDKIIAKAASNGTLDELPIFTGVPSAVKDLTAMRGTFTRLGSRGFKYFFTPFDSWVTKRMRNAGFVLLGKLATSEFGAMPVTEPDIHPPARNPNNQKYTTGGSSGGTAAAVVAGLIPFGQGSDGAGSIRIPSAICGCFGFKPSKKMNLIPAPKIDLLGFTTIGPISKNVEDAASLLDIMDGRATKEKSIFLKNLDKDFSNLKILVCLDNPIVKTDPLIRDSVEKVGKFLESKGNTIEWKEPIEATLEEFLPLWERQLANVPCLRENLLQPVTQWLRKNGRKLTLEEVEVAYKNMQEKVLNWSSDADFILTPTVAVFPPKIGEWKHLGPKESFSMASHLGVFTAPFNISGQPASSLPLGRNSDGLPFALQIAGRTTADLDVLAFSRYLEKVNLEEVIK
ncbi:MAG: amidase [Bacteriovoracaceae bacterium]|nr:amidase [Bacteriovoracaceae bacterium]